MPARALLATCLAASIATAAPPPLPERGNKDEPALLDPDDVLLPELPVPASLEEASAAAPARRRPRAPRLPAAPPQAPAQNATVENAALQVAAAALREKAVLYRAGKCTVAELRSAASEVNRAAATYRASLARR
jgi:hypothetical protein